MHRVMLSPLMPKVRVLQVMLGVTAWLVMLTVRVLQVIQQVMVLLVMPFVRLL